jgi:hypothetical protein
LSGRPETRGRARSRSAASAGCRVHRDAELVEEVSAQKSVREAVLERVEGHDGRPIGILLTPAAGAVLMSLSTMIVAINARLLRLSR